MIWPWYSVSSPLLWVGYLCISVSMVWPSSHDYCELQNIWHIEFHIWECRSLWWLCRSLQSSKAFALPYMELNMIFCCKHSATHNINTLIHSLCRVTAMQHQLLYCMPCCVLLYSCSSHPRDNHVLTFTQWKIKLLTSVWFRYDLVSGTYQISNSFHIMIHEVLAV